MKKITWIKLTSRRYGGAVYGQKAREALARDYNVEIKDIGGGFKYLKPLKWLWNFLVMKGKSDLWIRDDFYSIAFQFVGKTEGKKMAVIYHIDLSVFPYLMKILLWPIEKLFYSNIKRADAVLTIADFWKTHFLNKGCKKVYKISPALDLEKFNVSDREISEFKEKYNLKGKPIIYLGNCQEAKGVVESYEVLKDLDAYLVTSGEERVKIKALNFNLDYRKYLTLLKASTIVVTMSKFIEGWCITAHESMLLETPVIGSGKGGMKELLEGGCQIVCQDFSQLREKVEYLLNNPEERKRLGKRGREFAEKFNIERFKKEWLEMMKEILI